MNTPNDDVLYEEQQDHALFEAWYNKALDDFVEAMRSQGFEQTLSDLFDHVKHHERDILFNAMYDISK